MGFSVSWVGFETLTLSEVLQRIGFHDLGIEDEATENPFSIARLPTGWTIFFANKFDYGSGRHLHALSSGTTIVACQIEEHVMYSAARCFIDGSERWSVCHDGQRGTYDLSTSGTLPAQFASIKERFHSKQLKEPAKHLMTDYYFDMPVELARYLTGYRHDRWKFDWGKPRFTKLERADASQRRGC